MNPGKSPTPPPARVRYNDWRAVDAPAPEEFAPTVPVSVIIPSYRTPPDVLAKTLAALERQTYPRELFEVVIVDDGCEPPLARPQTPLPVKMVRQERRGFGLARARNTGVRAAAGEIILFLDSDLLAEAEWMRAHARWHHAVADALTIGLVAHVDADDIDAQTVRARPGSLKELLADCPAEPPWVESHLRMTNDLTTRDDDMFRMVSGGNCGIRREFYQRIGGCDESFAGWGGEDVEFGYRAYTFGGLLVPARDAFAWHQGLLLPQWESKRKSGEAQHAKAAHRIAHPRFRHASPGRTFTVPQHVVTITQDGQSVERLFDAAVKILADRVHDLVVRLPMASDDENCAWLQEQLAPDPRVRVHVSTAQRARASLDEFPTASFHIAVSASVPFAIHLVQRLHTQLGDAVTLRSVLPGGSVSITRGWALHRALRTGKDAADFGAAVSIRPAKLGLAARHGRTAYGEVVRTGSWNQRTKPSEWLRTAVGGLDNVEHARWFLKWVANGCAKAFAKQWRRLGERVDGRHGGASLPRWFVATMRRKARVAWWHLGSVVRGRRARAGSSRSTTGESAPVFDLRAYNPVGWRADVGDVVGALGPPTLLPPHVAAHCVVRRDALRRLRRLHHLEDTSAFHADIPARARDLVRLAAHGVLVHLADGDPRLEPLLGNRLFRLMTANARGLDACGREQLGVAMRRAALRDHSSWCHARQSREQLPLVSILLATKRPAFLPWALANVARQTYPAVELVLALHGDGFADVDQCLANLPQPVQVLRLPAREPLGAVLDAAARSATGTLLAKMDDDDAYGADHLWDLVLAREYSQAQLVGKWLEFIYLSAADRTIRWRNGGGERYQTSPPAGGALLISAADLRSCGGWRKVPAGVDTQLAEDVLRAGGRVYRTHAIGFLLIRHRCQHTWNNRAAAEESLVAKADHVWPGFQPDRAGVAAPDMPHPALPARDGPENRGAMATGSGADSH